MGWVDRLDADAEEIGGHVDGVGLDGWGGGGGGGAWSIDRSMIRCRPKVGQSAIALNASGNRSGRRRMHACI